MANINHPLIFIINVFGTKRVENVRRLVGSIILAALNCSGSKN